MKTKDDNIYYENEAKDMIYSENEWNKQFNDWSACMWYKCDNEDDKIFCEHPNYFCPKASNFKEVRHYGLDEDGSLMWEEV